MDTTAPAAAPASEPTGPPPAPAAPRRPASHVPRPPALAVPPSPAPTAAKAEEPDLWENATVIRNRRCSTVLWTDNNISREDAIARAEADPQCIGLMVNNTSTWTKDKRKAGTRGWYQGAGGSLGTIPNNSWDTIVKPTRAPPPPPPEPEPEPSTPPTPPPPPPKAYLTFVGYYMDDAGHTMQPAADFNNVDAATSKLLQRMQAQGEDVGFIALQAASDGQSTQVFESIGAEEHFKRIGKGGLRAPAVDVPLSSEVEGGFKQQGGAWCNAVYRIGFSQRPATPPPPPPEPEPEEPTTKEKAVETAKGMSVALLLSAPALVAPAFEALGALQNAGSQIMESLSELAIELPDEEVSPPSMPPSLPGTLAPPSPPELSALDSALASLLSIDAAITLVETLLAASLLAGLLAAVIVSHIVDTRPESNFCVDIRSVPGMVVSVVKYIWETIITVLTAWIGLIGGLFTLLEGLFMFMSKASCGGVQPLRCLLGYPAAGFEKLASLCESLSAWMWEKIVSEGTEEGVAEMGENGLTEPEKELFGWLRPDHLAVSQSHFSTFVLFNATILFLSWLLTSLNLCRLLIGSGEILADTVEAKGEDVGSEGYGLAGNALKMIPLLSEFQEALLFAQVWYVIFITGMFADPLQKGHSLDAGCLVIGLFVLASAMDHLQIDPGFLGLFPNFLTSSLSGDLAWLGILELTGLSVALVILAHKRYWPRPKAPPPETDAWQAAALLKARRCTLMLWQESNITREEAIERAEADPECIALMFSTKNNHTLDGRMPGTRGWYQGGGGKIAAVINDNWDTILKPIDEAESPAPKGSLRATPREGQSPGLPGSATRSTSLLVLGPTGEPLMFGEGFEEAKKASAPTRGRATSLKTPTSKKLELV